MEIDWDKFEATLVKSTIRELKRVGRSKKAETFYGSMFDCSASDAAISLALNTEEYLQMFAEYHTAESRCKRSIEEVKEQVRWCAPQFKYSPMETARFVSDLKPFLRPTNDAWFEWKFEDGDSEQFFMSVCNALLELERCDAFAAINTTDGFRALVSDDLLGEFDKSYSASEQLDWRS